VSLDDVAIVGIAATEQARRIQGEHTSMSLTIDVMDAALADAGLTRADVDGVALEWPGSGVPTLGTTGEATNWAGLLGHDLAWIADGFMDVAGVRGVLKAAAAISAGLCDIAVVGGAQTGMFSGGPIGLPVVNEFTDIWDAGIVPLFALIAQRHMHEFGTSPEQLAAVATSIRNYGYQNPEAVMYGKPAVSVEDVLNSRIIATPFHLLDLCVNAEGGGAVVLTSVERARDLPNAVVRVLGGGMQLHDSPYKNAPLYRTAGRVGSLAAARALGMAGLSYDPNTFEVIRTLEVLGACGEGEGGPYITDVGIGLDSTLPVNVDGGMLSYAWNGLQHQTLRVAEVVRQLRGSAVHQVAGARVGLAANAGSAAGHQEFLVLGRD
jgi:acetyl-CoA acetyltransferase